MKSGADGKSKRVIVLNWQVLVSNPLINAGVLSWITAQTIKLIYYYGRNKQVRLERLTGAGGMPSAHSAVSCSVTMSALLNYGFSNPVFAIAFILALIVLYDATGVRWSAGLHARALNQLIDHMEEKLPEEEKGSLREMIPELNESLGHRPIEVVFGSLLGVAIASLLQLAYS